MSHRTKKIRNSGANFNGVSHLDDCAGKEMKKNQRRLIKAVSNPGPTNRD
jgi:hypothetical protein